MKRLNITQKKDALTNFLKKITKNETLFIHNAESGRGQKFAIMEKQEIGYDVKSNFMTYEEMNCFFMGILAVKESRIKL